jgi:hypothetical protein
MITEESIRKFITGMGYIPASPESCAYFINDFQKRGQKEINFFISKNNICWVTALRGDRVNGDKIITVTMEQLIRDIKLEELNV